MDHKLSKDALPPAKAKGNDIINKLKNTPLPRLKEDGTVDKSKTVGDVVADAAIKLALTQIKEMQSNKAASVVTAVVKPE